MVTAGFERQSAPSDLWMIEEYLGWETVIRRDNGPRMKESRVLVTGVTPAFKVLKK